MFLHSVSAAVSHFFLDFIDILYDVVYFFMLMSFPAKYCVVYSSAFMDKQLIKFFLLFRYCSQYKNDQLTFLHRVITRHTVFFYNIHLIRDAFFITRPIPVFIYAFYMLFYNCISDWDYNYWKIVVDKWYI